MSQEAIRQDIYDVLVSMNTIGQVHDRERWAAEWDDYLALFKTQINGVDQICGAEVIYKGFAPIDETFSTCSVVRAHNFVIVFLLGLNDEDATEKTAAELVEDIADELDTDSVLNGSLYFGRFPSAVETFELRNFGGVLCHYAEIRKIVAEDFTWAS